MIKIELLREHGQGGGATYVIKANNVAYSSFLRRASDL